MTVCIKEVNDGYILLPGLPYRLKGQYGFHQMRREIQVSQEAFGERNTQNKIGLSSQKNKWCC